MIENVMVKTHLIVTSIHEEFTIKWCGRIIDTKPIFKNDMPIFTIISSVSRVELNTCDMKRVEECAKKITCPRGRAAMTTDKAYIYIQEVDNHETLVGIVTHNHVKKYAPMFDPVGYKS